MRLHCRILPKFPKSLFLHLSQWHHTEKVFPISKNSVFCILADSLIIYLSFDYFPAVINVPTYDTICSMFKSKWACPLLANGKVPWQTYNFSCNQFEFKLSSMVPFFSLSINWWIFGQQHLIWLTLPYTVCFVSMLGSVIYIFTRSLWKKVSGLDDILLVMGYIMVSIYAFLYLGYWFIQIIPSWCWA
jgi:hypothetical protein